MSTEFEYTATMAGDQALMESLEAINKLEGENKTLKAEVTELKTENGRLKEGGTDVQLKELIRVNHQWDVEYRQQEEAFQKYRIDSQRAQHENQGYIAKLKEEKDYQAHEIATLKRELSRGSHGDSQHEIAALKREIAQYERIIGNLRQKIQAFEQQGGRHGDEGRRIRQLEEELSLTKQQVTAYKEDFEAERRDRERLVEEKQSMALRYDAEITSLKLQLDRCRNELQHYSTEATRLAQQLRIKSQYEEDQYKKHLESRGYVSRGTNGTLPPLDPFVEHDPPSMHHPPPKIYEPPQQNRALQNSPKAVPRTNAPLRPESAPQRRISAPQRNHLLARSSDTEDSVSAPASFGNEYVPAPTVQRNMTPSPTHFRRQTPPNQNYPASTYQNGYAEQPPRGPYPNEPPRNHIPNGNGYIMQNGGIVRPKPRVEVDSSEPSPLANGISNGHHVEPQHVTSDGQVNIKTPPSDTVTKNRTNGEVKADAKNRTQPPEVQKIPPMQTKGRHKCPRCARRFQHSAECEDHKARCIS